MPPALLKIQLKYNFSFDMLFVKGGEFVMGNDEGDNSEKPAHKVSVYDFYIGKFQVTQELWEKITGNKPSFFKGGKRPVEKISWEEAQGFIKKLNKVSGKDFRLPTEAEWEYAARGGQYSQGYAYCGSDKLRQVGWYRDNSKEETKEVGLLLSNELGLYDMSGNVWEWCEDDWHNDYEGAPRDGSPWIDTPKRGDLRVMRGGSYFYNAEYCRPSLRFRVTPGNRDDSIGFRLVLSLQFTP